MPEPLSDVETLRAAATRTRELAPGADALDSFERPDGVVVLLHAAAVDLPVTHVRPPFLGGAEGRERTLSLADHLVAMSWPPFVLALAEWLEKEARFLLEIGEATYCKAEALAVARAFLDGAS
jgi:hypothetical protein